MTETEKMLKAVLVMQAEILGRLDRLESSKGNRADEKVAQAIGLTRTQVDRRVELITELEGAMDSTTGNQIEDSIRSLIGKLGSH